MDERAALVLIVDDDPDIVRMLASMLHDYRILTATNGTEALELIERRPVDLVLADHMMPGLTGVELLQRTQLLRPRAVRILITASDRVSDASDAINVARVHRFVCKPVRAVELRGVVAGALRELALEEELRTKNDILRRALSAVEVHQRDLRRQVELRTRELDELKLEFTRLGFRDTRARSSVLVVTPDLDAREQLRAMLPSEAFFIDEASTLADAQAVWATKPVDLIIAEERLRDGSGADLMIGGSDSEVVLMGGDADADSVVRALTLGVADYLIKPLADREDVLPRLQRVLRGQAIKRMERERVSQLQDLVTRDPLTGLFNHAHFQESLERELLRAQRHGHEVSLIMLDVDRFLRVNEEQGHLAGDGVLKAVARILAGNAPVGTERFRLRGQDTVARFGGDEFTIILPETPKGGAAIKAEQLRAFVERFDFSIVGLGPQTVSVGVASFPGDAQDREGLVAAADAALFAAKGHGRNAMVSYVASLGARSPVQQRQAAEREGERIAALEEAIRDGAFGFVYQPIVDVRTGRPMGYEALCRPTHRSFDGPMPLFAAAERAGRVVELGRASRRVAIRPLARLPEPLALFVNLHPHELNDSLLSSAETEVAAYSTRLVLEITESAAIRDTKRLARVLDGLRATGFRIALDDLGSGYAGLNSLSLLKPDFVKLDMSLVRRVTTDGGAARLVRHILEFALGEGMTVIAEGVETTEELDAVRQLECPLAQGYLLARPSEPFVLLEA